MKPITFENLRRLVGGGRKKKEKESSFKRSDSFKRISIRKSYLDRGKKKHLQKLEVATQTVTEEICKVAEVTISKVDTSVQVDRVEASDDVVVVHENNKKEVKRGCVSRTTIVGNCGSGPGQSVIAYGQWLKGIRKDDVPAGGFKGAERTVIYVPACDENKLPSPVIRQLSSSPVFRKKSPLPSRKTKIVSPTLQRKESNDSAVEMFPWGDSTEVKKSPLFKRKTRQTPPLLPEVAPDELCSLSISLGRIWMDAPQAMAPRSLEMPKSSGVAVPAHHSLDSALKDLRDDPTVFNRLQKRPVPPVSRTLSSTSNTTASTGLFSSKDSGFSFSISVPKLSDFNSSSSRGFFRKKRPKPKLSVSREGYFKRTSGALVETKRTSVRRRSSRKKNRSSGRSKRGRNMYKNDLYQVVVSRPPRSLTALKLDPMIFVPPEKRKSSIKRKQSFKIGVQEIRNVNPLDSSMYTTSRSLNESADEGLYESLPGEYDDFSDEQPLSGRISRISLRDDDYDFPSNDFMSATPVSEESAVSVAVSDDDIESNEDSSSSKSGSPYVPPGVSPVPKRRPVKRKPGLTHKRSITYVAKPTIMRAPSTLRRPIKKSGKLFE